MLGGVLGQSDRQTAWVPLCPSPSRDADDLPAPSANVHPFQDIIF